MAILAGILIACALFITMGFTLFTDAKLLGIARDGFRDFRKLPPDLRRRSVRMMVSTYLISGGYVVFLAIAPFGRRDTIIWFLVVPFLVLVPIGTIAAGVRGYRMGRGSRHDPGHGAERRTPPSRERAPYKYGGSLGWIASTMDPETSSWKPQSLDSRTDRTPKEEPDPEDKPA